MYSSIPLHCAPSEMAAAFHDRTQFVFLDSSRNDDAQGRYSILAWEPQAVFRTKGEDPFPSLERLLLQGIGAGAIGYFGYDLFRFLEQYDRSLPVDDLGLPDCCLAVYDTIATFDHRNHSWTLESTSQEKLERRLAEIERSRTNPVGVRSSECDAGPPESNMTKLQYIDRVRRALDYIAAGDIYQVNLAQRFSHRFEGSPFRLFSILREVSPSFYGAYLNCGDHVVISSSPELFLRREGSLIETRPIKGTRPRGRTQEEDAALEKDLLSSHKEAAELTMILDLERNDLGRVCEYGSVEAVQHRYVDRLPSLFHTVSTVRGKLREGTGAVDILRATFPGGSISGCPKIRAIEIIAELEPVGRHVYTGAIGLIRSGGDLTLNVAIRTMTVAGNRLYYHSGGGIVADSIPDREYEETLDKAAGMQEAIARSCRLRAH